MGGRKRRFVTLAEALDGSQIVARGYASVLDAEHESGRLPLADQERRIRSYAQERGWALDRVYCDDGAAGAEHAGKHSRRAFASMLRGAKGAEFSVLICLDQNRIAADARVRAYYLNLLQNHGVDVAFLDGHDKQDRKTRDQVREIVGAIKEAEGSVKSQIFRDAMRKKAKQGLWVGSPPDGYDSAGTGGVLKPNRRAHVIRMIFEWFLAERSIRGVAQRLIQADIKPLRGGEWHRAAIRRCLCNPAYAGWIEWKGKRYPGAHKPLVTQKVFEKARDIITETGALRPRPEAPAKPLLTPLAHCGYCGFPMWVVHTKKTHKYYICSRNHNRIGGTRCAYHEREGKKFRVRDFRLEDAVAKDILALREDEILSLAGGANAKPTPKETKVRRGLQEVRSRLAQLRLTLSGLDAMKTAGRISPMEFSEWEADYKAEQARLRIEEQGLEHALKSQPPTPEDIERTVAAVRDFQSAAVENAWDIPTKRRKLARLLERVDVTQSGAVIQYKGRILGIRKAPLE